MKYANGAFCFFRPSSRLQPMLPSEIAQMAQQHGVPVSIIPQYAGHRAQVARAIAQINGQCHKRGYVLTSIKLSSREVVYGISTVRKDKSQERVDHTFTDRLRWDVEGGNGAHVEGAHQIAQDVDAAYQLIRDKVVASDWTEAVTSYLRNECQAQAMRNEGYVYWLPPTALVKLPALTAFLDAVGIAIVIAEVEAVSTPVVQQAAQEGLADQLQSLQEDVNAFTGKEKPSNYRSRIAEFRALRRRALVYKETLGLGVEQAEAVLNDLETRVQTLLTGRLDTVIHRDGTSTAAHITKPVAAAARILALAAEGPDAIAAALRAGSLDVQLPTSW